MRVECVGGPCDGVVLDFKETLRHGAIVGIGEEDGTDDRPSLYRFEESFKDNLFVYVGENEELGGDR